MRARDRIGSQPQFAYLAPSASNHALDLALDNSDSKRIMEPALLVRDNRKLVYQQGQRGKQLRSLREADIVAIGDTSLLASTPSKSEDDFEASATYDQRLATARLARVDFIYSRPHAGRVAVELKLSAKHPSPSLVHNAFNQLRHAGVADLDRVDFQELWALTPDASTLLIWSDEGGEPTQYGLANVISLSVRSDAFSERAPIDTAYVQHRVDIWETQIEQLFQEITRWSIDDGCTVDSKSNVTMNEEMMQLFGVHPRSLPALRIKRSNKVIVTARPVGLWIIGAAGRVDLLMANASASLVNVKSFPSEPEWQMYENRASTPQALNKARFLNFVHENERT